MQFLTFHLSNFVGITPKLPIRSLTKNWDFASFSEVGGSFPHPDGWSIPGNRKIFTLLSYSYLQCCSYHNEKYMLSQGDGIFHCTRRRRNSTEQRNAVSSGPNSSALVPPALPHANVLSPFFGANAFYGSTSLTAQLLLFFLLKPSYSSNNS